MYPQIVQATPFLTFNLSEKYRATLLIDVESAGMIQYLHVLSIEDTDGIPVLHFGAEWSTLQPEFKDEPIFGQFDASGHSSDTEFPECRDLPLFLMRAVSVARRLLQVPDEGLVDGEVWAVGQMVMRLGSGDVADRAIADMYRATLDE